MRRALPILILALALLAAGCGGSDDTEGTTVTTEATDTTATVGPDGCSDVTVPEAREDGGATEPKERLDPEKTYKLVFKTNCGSFTVTLDQAKAPATSASLVSLAKSGFYDNTIFHRIVPGFVIQGGDPTQAGNGGPGYQTVDPPPSGSTYSEGIVAMAKLGLGARRHRGQPVLRRQRAQRRDVAAGLRDRRHRDERNGHRQAHRRLRRCERSGRDANPSGRRRVGDGRGIVSIAAVVLAAGEASRFGTPKQRLLLPEVLERLDQSVVDDIVVVAGAHTLETPARVVTCAGWKRGPGASLTSGLEDLDGDVEAAIVVLADGPDLNPQAIERVIASWRADGGPVVAASYSGERGHPLLIAREAWDTVPDEGLRVLEARLVPCDDLGDPGDVNTPADLPPRLR